MAAGTADSTSCSDINVTPLIDVMLVLLIIFIITLPGQTHAVKIDNPSTHSEHRKIPVIDLSIDFDGTLLWNGQPVNREALQNDIGRQAKAIPQPEVHISVDKFARYEIVAQTLADLQHQGLDRIGFVNEDYR